MHQILLASTNKGKLAELREPLAKCNFEVLGLDAFPDFPEVEENGTTFEDNALLKARAAAAFTGLISIADDSGLEVDALGGLPGVHSARYSDDMPHLPSSNRDERNILKLLAALSEKSVEQRAARFCCVMAVAKPNGTTITSTGFWNGRILFQPRGNNGFGYDPIFFDPNLGCAAAELSKDIKMLHSHRAKALIALFEKLPSFLQE